MDIRKAANRLHHLSMRYVGALYEACTGKAIGVIPSSHPGLKECRDFIDQILYTRAEISGLTNLLVKKGVFTAEEYTKEMAEQYEYFCNVKAKQLNVEVEDYGLVFKVEDQPKKHEGN